MKGKLSHSYNITKCDAELEHTTLLVLVLTFDESKSNQRGNKEGSNYNKLVLSKRIRKLKVANGLICSVGVCSLSCFYR